MCYYYENASSREAVMARHTSSQEFSFGDRCENRFVVPDNGTSLTVEYWTGLAFVEDSSSPVTSPSSLFTRNSKIRITPSAGGFLIDEDDRL